MNSSPKLLVSLCFILISQLLLPTNTIVHGFGDDGLDMIGQTCNKILAADRRNCIKILGADSEVVSAKNYFEFSRAALELSINKGIEGQNFLKKMVKSKYSPAVAQCANVSYGLVIASFRGALNLLKDDPLLANYNAGVASDGPAMCERLLADAHIVNPEISALNHQIVLLSGIASMATENLFPKETHKVNLE